MSTVNVITTDIQGMIQALNAYQDTLEGNKKAESVFREKLNSVLDLDCTDDDAEVMLQDGYAVNGDGETCQLVQSTEHIEL
ncbi:MAG: hypothetical protein V3V85_00525 [Candidatus Thorarchaeota archaeon]